MKPSWDDSPIWAQWLAMDQGGIWCWFECKPVIENHYWIQLNANKHAKSLSIFPLPWKETLQKRPDDEKN